MVKKFSIQRRLSFLVSVLLVLALVACSLLVPPSVKIVDSPYEKEVVISAVDNFVYQWWLVFEEDITPRVNNIRIEFYKKTQEEWDGKCIRGSSDPYNFNKIRVAYIRDNTFPIYQTTIWHELTHVTLGKKWKTGDYNHSEPGGPWLKKHDQLIASLKAQAKAQELVWNTFIGNNWYYTELIGTID